MSDQLSISPSPTMLFGSLIAQLPGTKELAAFLVVVCFSAGLNIYATVAILGLFSHANILLLPPQLQGGELVRNRNMRRSLRPGIRR